MSKLSPAWFLFLFAPITAEYLSGSSPFLNPFVIIANMILYGCGILIIRELRVRWRQGWLAVFVLSIAYTIAEEGLMLNTVFNPNQNTTGRFAGVNWVWTTGMLVVHSMLSIMLPLLVAESIYADQAGKSWIKPGTFWLALALFVADVFGLGHAFAPKDRPGWGYFVMELGLVAACLVAARFIPRRTPEPVTTSPVVAQVSQPAVSPISQSAGPDTRQAHWVKGRSAGWKPAIQQTVKSALLLEGLYELQHRGKLWLMHNSVAPARSPRWYFFAFLIGTIITLAAGFDVPALPLPTLAQIALMLAIYLGFLIFAQRNHAFAPTLPPLSKLACAGGIISFWILVSPLSALIRQSAGPVIVAPLMILFLLAARKRIVREYGDANSGNGVLASLRVK